MCAKPEEAYVLRTLAELIEDLNVEEFAWAGVRVLYGFLESV